MTIITEDYTKKESILLLLLSLLPSLPLQLTEKSRLEIVVQNCVAVYVFYMLRLEFPILI